MNKKTIDSETYSLITDHINYDWSYTDLNEDKIIKIYEYLKNKSIKGNNSIIYNAHLLFLDQILESTKKLPDYNKATKMFLNSKYLSSELKKEMISVLKDNCPNDTRILLNSQLEIKDFNDEEIEEIISCLEKSFNKNLSLNDKRKCVDIINIYNDYMFSLDSNGPIQYIKNNFDDVLPIIILENSGIINENVRLNEKYLISIYQKILKYYPDQAIEFVNIVSNIPILNISNFIDSYLLFICNVLNNNIKYNDMLKIFEIKGVANNKTESKAMINRFIELVDECQVQEKNKTKILK